MSVINCRLINEMLIYTLMSHSAGAANGLGGGFVHCSRQSVCAAALNEMGTYRGKQVFIRS